MTRTHDPIAVVGMACRFPGAPDLGSFWELLRAGRSAITEVPAERWDVDEHYDPQLGAAGKMNTRWGGFIENIAEFDHSLFGLSRKEASWIDPQHRMLLEQTHAALADAGWDATRIAGSRTGVFVGAGNSDYATLCLGDVTRTTAYSLTGNLPSLAANRLSNQWDLRGPSLCVDTACSSSLVALHLACRSLRSDESDAAVVGAANAILLPNPSVAMSQAWILSIDGKCRAFDAKADGYVRGEGCGVVVLKRLDDAIREGDRVIMVIRSTAINQDGFGDGLTTPDVDAQAHVIAEAVRDAGVAAEQMDYIEAHGIGSRLTDACEIRALRAALGPRFSIEPPCRIGSVKTNIGHLEGASGLSALIKVALCLHHRTMVPSLHFDELSPDIEKDGFGFDVPTAACEWPRGKEVRTAGVNSFGIGGTNVHTVVQEPWKDVPRKETVGIPAPVFHRKRLWAVADPAAADASPPIAPEKPARIQRLESLPVRERWAALADMVRSDVCEVLDMGPDAVDDQRGFFEMGMTSLMAVELHGRLKQSLAITTDLPATAVFNAPTIESLARLIATDMLAIDVPVPAWSSPPSVRASTPGRSAQPGSTEQIAIVGMACRFPGGAHDPSSFWRLVRDGEDTIEEVPPERWSVEDYYDPDPNVPGKMYTKWGGFIDGVDEFDPRFFGISPREADVMDPQHRWMLMVSWEALEHAGIAPDSLARTRTGVFVGIGHGDYAEIMMQSADPARIDAYCGTGNLLCGIAGRVSSLLGLQGPALVVDTACSSSLVSIHLACQSLLRGESDCALAGGVNLILSPHPTVALCQTKSLSPDGRCRSFDAGANGYVRGEGCGVVVLKRMTNAVADGDRIWGVIRGSAVNHDGPSAGFTVPSGPAQEAVIRDAHRAAGVSPLDISYVETHGTGTELGDPIEAGVIRDVFGPRRNPDQPLHIGSVKASIGHLEAAAGVASAIKVVLALHHEAIPPQGQFTTLNPHIDWQGAPVVIPTKIQEWPSATSGGRPRLAGVSSFGMSGTNAHLVLEEAPPPATQVSGAVRPDQLLALSSESESALKSLAERYRPLLSDAAPEVVAGICDMAARGRAHGRFRLGVVGSTGEAMDTALSTWVGGARPSSVAVGTVTRATRPTVAFLFTGQGSQYVGMGSELRQSQPVFDRALRECNDILREHMDRSLLDLLDPDLDEPGLLNKTAYTQPALFALDYALARLWLSWGIQPSFLMGHSIGEYAAACVAGVFALEDALALIAARGRLMQALPRDGAMAAVLTSEEDVCAVLVDHPAICVAAVNGPANTVVSGRRDALDSIVAAFEERGTPVHALSVSHAFHSDRIEPMLDAFEEIASGLTYGRPRIPVISNLSGRVAEGDDLCAPSYWRRHAREAVRFAPGMDTLVGSGCNVFIETGPSPVLAGMGRRCVEAEGASWIPSLRPGVSDHDLALKGLAQLYVRGAEIRWESLYPDGRPARVELPTYPFQRKRHWMDAIGVRRDDADQPAPVPGSWHPLLGRRLRSALRTVQFENTVRPSAPSYLDDHRIYETVVAPAASHIAMAVCAARESMGWNSCKLENWTFPEPLVLSDPEFRVVQLTLEPKGPAAASVGIHSLRDESDRSEWTLHAAGDVRRTSGDVPQAVPGQRRKDLQSRIAGEMPSTSDFYDRIRESGIQLGPTFRWIDRLWLGDGEILGRMRLARPEDEANPYPLFPGLIDSCFQLVAGLLHGRDVDGTAWVPIGITALYVHRSPSDRVWCHMHWQGGADGANRETLTVGLRLLDEHDRLIVEVDRLQIKRAPRSALLRVAQRDASAWLYQTRWIEQPPAASDPESLAPGWVVVGGDSHTTESVRQVGEQSGHRVLDIGNVDEPRMEDALRPALNRSGSEPTHVLYVSDLGVGTEASGDAVRDGLVEQCWRIARILRVLSAVETSGATRLWVVTRNAQCEPGGADRTDAAAAGLWGFGKSIALEHPERWGGLVDLQGSQSPEQIRSLYAHIRSSEGENLAALRGSVRWVGRLEPKRLPARTEEQAPPIRPDGTYLITGGLGALGMASAGWLVERGARRIVLASRRAPTESTAKAIADWTDAGAEVIAVQADVSDVADITRLLDQAVRSGAPLRGIVHAAGIIDDGLLSGQTRERLDAVIAPKVSGGWTLHQQTREQPLDFVVFFSSLAAVLGSAGQAGYAAANAFLDGLARARKEDGLPALSIGWGPWDDVGMAADEDQRRRRARVGVGGIPTAEGMGVLGRLLTVEEAEVAVLPIEWSTFVRQFPAGNPWPYLARVAAGGTFAADVAEARDRLLDRLSRTAPDDRSTVLQEHVDELVRRILGMDATESLDPAQPLNELGMDSLMGLELTNTLSVIVGEQLPATLPFNHPTIEAIAAVVGRAMLPGMDDTGSGQVPARGADEETRIADEVNQMSVEEMADELADELAKVEDIVGGPLT